MNEAHVHMVVNHFPIIGTILGLGILIAGMILKNTSVKNTAYCLFVIAAIFAAISMGTGEGAEEMVEDMPSVGKEIIHEHEEMAEKLAIVLYSLGVISLIGLFVNYKKHRNARSVSYIAVVVAIIGVFFAQQTGTTGGEIRHTEIRPNAVSAGGAEQNAAALEEGESENKE
ncbi:hypothetical protein [Flavobacterium nackdongense]|uniref:DUF2231 domain-containing protein n=1 Tax=Flavobacterium nackdongense TaxID=2547394 RepID=A0A4P6Y5U0_9FLAO|nr:hypothetical protein [Flavobacterium nackdongense]QBN17559.1 hypothetical protein E1750_01675 [Flavobacterium nackdongense]